MAKRPSVFQDVDLKTWAARVAQEEQDEKTPLPELQPPSQPDPPEVQRAASTLPSEGTLTVEPGDQYLTITYPPLEFPELAELRSCHSGCHLAWQLVSQDEADRGESWLSCDLHLLLNLEYSDAILLKTVTADQVKKLRGTRVPLR